MRDDAGTIGPDRGRLRRRLAGHPVDWSRGHRGLPGTSWGLLGHSGTFWGRWSGDPVVRCGRARGRAWDRLLRDASGTTGPDRGRLQRRLAGHLVEPLGTSGGLRGLPGLGAGRPLLCGAGPAEAAAGIELETAGRETMQGPLGQTGVGRRAGWQPGSPAIRRSGGPVARWSGDLVAR